MKLTFTNWPDARQAFSEIQADDTPEGCLFLCRTPAGQPDRWIISDRRIAGHYVSMIRGERIE